MQKQLNVLILGGSRFVGRHITYALLANGHRVTHFNRGISNPHVRSDVETIQGDRTTDLGRLGDRKWDAVIDTSGYTPDVVERSARYFADRAAHYVFISTISVYDPQQTNGPDEDSPLSTLPPDASRTKMVPETYGALKVLCEEILRSTFRQRVAILRPSLVAGPDDPTDRFTYWPVRVASGGQILAPVAATEPLQYIDARDLAEFAVHVLEHRDSGTYNCVTPRSSSQFGDLLDACVRVAHSSASITWADAQFLSEHDVAPWAELPLWIPDGNPHRSITNADSSRALVRGLRIRPLIETVRDTLTWARAAGKQLGSLQAGLAPERERALLSAFRSPGEDPAVA